VLSFVEAKADLAWRPLTPLITGPAVYRIFLTLFDFPDSRQRRAETLIPLLDFNPVVALLGRGKLTGATINVSQRQTG
jgi:hypothetical protein